MNGEYLDFIASYKNAAENDLCDAIIKAFEDNLTSDAIYCEDGQFANSNAGRFDWATDLSLINKKYDEKITLKEKLNKILIDNLREYVHVFGHMKQEPLQSLTQKIQKTPAGGGYHVWHDENSSGKYEHSSRVLVWMLYLNDDYEGGETEFLYYKTRIKGEKGKLLIWPAGITHAHRGGLVLDGTKYVATGWFSAFPD